MTMDALRVLVVGGYGGFGGRLVDLLLSDNVPDILVAGRSLERARVFCDSRAGAPTPVVLDRSVCCRAVLEKTGPDIVVDAAGPFQCYGERRFSLIETCIDLGINYLDLADGRAFVCGVGRFDAQAQARGVFVLSGTSSVPALSSAAIRVLTLGLDKVERIDIGITPAGGVSMGINVMRAILSYAGRPVDIREDGAWRTRYCWTDLHRKQLSVSDSDRLNRRFFSLCDVPDLELWPQRFPDIGSVRFSAALEPAFLHFGMAALAWLVRLGVVPRPQALAPMLHRVAKWMPSGVAKGGMFVRVTGQGGTDGMTAKQWSLIADGDHGPNIPAMAAAAVVAKMRGGWCPEPGARACTDELDLSDFEPQFAKFDIRTSIRKVIEPDVHHA